MTKYVKYIQVRYLLIINFTMKKFLFQLIDKIWNYIYKKRPLYKKRPIDENILKDKSIDEINFLKESEHDFLSFNIPAVLAIFWLILTINVPRIKAIFIILLVIVSVNIAIAHEETENNIIIYNKILWEKLNKQKEDDEKYRKKILNYLKNIEKWLKKSEND